MVACAVAACGREWLVLVSRVLLLLPVKFMPTMAAGVLVLVQNSRYLYEFG
eukprot:m.292615 g.292615  ORF g.292615 m.292615 type:complete len:51 (-) comp230685_c0_seq1:49-201(-)